MSAAGVQERFVSKRDRWLVILIRAGAAISLGGAALVAWMPGPLLVRVATPLLLLASAALSLWVLYGTDYRVDAERIAVRCGPFRYRIPLAEIESVTPSSNPISSPACSLDRLEIRWGGRRRLLVSPEARERFLALLAERCPQLRRAGEVLRRP